ncbi:cytochrome P450 [Streptomyces sp. NPDC054841]
MSSQNPPRHTRMRTAVARRFVEHVRCQQPWFSRLCDQAIEPVVETLRNGVADMTALAETIPRDTIMHLLGLPQGDRDLVSALVADIFPTSGPLPGQDRGGAAAMRQLTDYLQAEVVRRRRTPGDDLMSELVRAHTDCPEALPHDELVSIVTGLMVAGYPQIAAGIETGIVLMMRHPARAVFLDGPAGARMFVDEVLRYDAPVQFTPAPRIPAKAVVLSGVPIPAGAQVWPVLGAANRDPGVFSRPDEFRPGRDGTRHLSFGGGAHYCLGAELVYLEMSMVLRRLRQRLPDLAPAQPPVQRSGRLRGFTSVPVVRAER